MALFTAIATAVGSLFTSGFAASAFGKFLIKTLARVATSLLVKAISGGNTSGYSGLQGTLQSGEEVPRGAPFGKCASEGSLVYANTWGKAGKTPNAYFTQVIALSDLPIKGVLRVMVNGSYVTLLTPADADKGSPVSEFRLDGVDHLWVKIYDGTQTAADTFMVNSVSSDERPYEATRVGTGVAYAICTSRINQTLFTTFPKFRFELDSVRLYDPSKDTTAGGSGTQRWSNPATWGGDGDYLPVVQAYNIMRGITYAGTWLFGFNGMSAGRIPLPDAIASINACRATVAVGASKTEPRYRAGGYLQFSSECGSVLEAIMMAAAGRIVDIGGVYKIQVGSGSTAVDASITDADLRSEHDAPFYPVKGLADLINGVTAQYPNPADGYNPKDAKAIYRTDLEALDQSRRLPVQLSFSNVPYAHQVRRLMRTAIGEARRFRRHTLPLPSDFWALEPGDVIAWTSDRHGYTEKKFRVTAVMEEPTSEITADCVEIDPSDYDPPDYSDYPTVPTWQSVIKLPAVETLRGWNVTAGTAKDGAGDDRRPTIVCEWDTDDLDGCEGVEIEIALNGGATFFKKFVRKFKAGRYVWDNPLPDTAYMARGFLVADRPTDWTGWENATTGDVKFSFADMADPFIAAFDAAANDAATALSGHNALVSGFSGTLVDGFNAVNTATTALAATQASHAASIGGLNTSVTNILGCRADLMTGTALAALLSQLSVSTSTGLSAWATSQAAAVATLNGKVSASYVFRVGAGGAGAGLEMVAQDSAVGGPVSTFKINADYIDLVGKVRVTDMLVVGQGNLFPDFDMADDRFYFNTSGGVFSFIATATAPLGARYLALNADTVIQTVYSRWFRVDPSTEYRITGAAWTQTATAGTGTATLYAQTASVDAGGVASVLTTNAVKATTDATYSSATSWGTIALTTGSTARLMRFAMARAAGGTGGARFGGFMVDRKVGSDFIVNGAVTAAALNADDLNIAGVSIFGPGGLKSSNYAESGGIPTAGFKITHDGVIKGKSIILRDALADGSASDKAFSTLAGPVNLNDSLGYVYLTHTVGAVAERSILKRGVSFEARHVSPGGYATDIYFQIRRKYAGVWGAWETLKTWSFGASESFTAWRMYADSGTLAGVYDDVQYRVASDRSASGAAISGIRNINITTINLVK